MKKPATLTIPTLLLLATLAGAAGLDAAAPHRVFLPIAQRGYRRPEACLPRFALPEELVLELDRPPGLDMMHTGDFDGNGWTDLVVARLDFGTSRTFEIDILLNDGAGNLEDGTLRLFSGPVPQVQHARGFVVADFNGDYRDDIFIANEGQDAPPFPGYQNTLVLSSGDGSLVDATSKLPQRYDETHSATAADIDGDGDVDLYVGNLGGGGVPPDILLNDGTGRFQVAVGLLPQAQRDVSQNWYTSSEFADVNNDGFPDLILGQGDPDRDSHVLLNDGGGRFSKVSTPLPPTIFAPIQQILDIKASDISGDGYLDLILLDTRNSYVGRYVQVLINNGDATFRDETPARLPQSTNTDAAVRFVNLLDLDYDGDVDIVGEAWAGEGHPFYLNDGRGYYYAWDKGFEIHGHVFAFLDISGDGRRDIVRGWSANDWIPEQYHVFRDLGCP
jgi:hypothetical protein